MINDWWLRVPASRASAGERPPSAVVATRGKLHDGWSCRSRCRGTDRWSCRGADGPKARAWTPCENGGFWCHLHMTAWRSFCDVTCANSATLGTAAHFSRCSLRIIEHASHLKWRVTIPQRAIRGEKKTSQRVSLTLPHAVSLPPTAPLPAPLRRAERQIEFYIYRISRRTRRGSFLAALQGIVDGSTSDTSSLPSPRQNNPSRTSNSFRGRQRRGDRQAGRTAPQFRDDHALITPQQRPKVCHCSVSTRASQAAARSPIPRPALG
jgi:hypothetical protein